MDLSASERAELEELRARHCEPQETVLDVLRRTTPDHRGVAAALVNGEMVPLYAAHRRNTTVRGVPLQSEAGMGVYRQSLCLLLAAAAAQLHPRRCLRVEHGFGLESSRLSRAYYCELAGAGDALTPAEVDAIAARMGEIARADAPVREERMDVADAVAHFSASGQEYQAEHLLARSSARAVVLRLGAFRTLSHADRGRIVLPGTGPLTSFRLLPHDRGVALVFPDALGAPVKPFRPLPNVSLAYRRVNGWAAAAGLASVGALNAMIARGAAEEAVSRCEAVHLTRVVEIAREVAERHRGGARVVLVGGPSSSGKTTFAARLRRLLTARCLSPVTLSSDDYYRARDDTYPRTEAGELNHEVIDALDLPLFNAHLAALLRGEEVDTPVFDFTAERRSDRTRRVRLPEDGGVLVIEGIFCLNERLTSAVRADQKYLVYCAPMSQLNLDELHYMSSQLVRLIRRICRDFRHRNRDARATIRKWAAVRRGEEENLFPHIGNADAVFNSSLDYELCVLKVYVQPLLENVRPAADAGEYTVARQLLGLCSRFHPIPAVHVPTSSLLQEFLN